MNKINFQNGTKVSDAKVTIDGTDYTVTPAQYSGSTPVSATNLNQVQTNTENAINQTKEYIDKMFAFNNAYTYTGSNMTSNNGTVQSYSAITVRVNELGTIAYVEGTVYNNHLTNGAATVTLSSALRPDSTKTTLNILTNYNNDATGEQMSIATNGTITMTLYGPASGNSRHTITPNLIFLKDWAFV